VRRELHVVDVSPQHFDRPRIDVDVHYLTGKYKNATNKLPRAASRPSCLVHPFYFSPITV
jgi:hypothetical protein